MSVVILNVPSFNEYSNYTLPSTESFHNWSIYNSDYEDSYHPRPGIDEKLQPDKAKYVFLKDN